jgi:hypothetical protein
VLGEWIQTERPERCWESYQDGLRQICLGYEDGTRVPENFDEDAITRCRLSDPSDEAHGTVDALDGELVFESNRETEKGFVILVDSSRANTLVETRRCRQGGGKERLGDDIALQVEAMRSFFNAVDGFQTISHKLMCQDCTFDEGARDIDARNPLGGDLIDNFDALQARDCEF